MDAFLILEDGTVFKGTSIGAEKEVISEVVFNTSMTGYLEVLTDPSYAGQAVVMTYPLIGNYGICYEDMESAQPWPDAFIVRELSRMPSNFRSENTIQNFLKKNEVPGIAGIDTRALTKRLRDEGTMNGMITTHRYHKEEMPALLERIKAYKVEGVVKKTSTKEVYVAQAENPDGIMISNGPGDPKENVAVIEEIKKLYASETPIFAICLGHQLMALATGADTYKLKYGHRGGNHPVKDLSNGRVYITSQNHGYAVDPKTIDPAIAEEAFVNVNDGTNEGLRYKGKNIVTVQYHPEACPGPRDSAYLFDRFMKMMEG